MRKVEKVKKQIRALSREDIAELRDWFLGQAWDEPVASSRTGALDSLVADALAAHDARQPGKS